MKLIPETSVLRLTHEGITNFASLSDFYKKSIDNFPSVYKNSVPDVEACSRKSITAEASVAGANISSISFKLITYVNAAKHYESISRVMNPQNMSYASFLATFKIEHEARLFVKDEDNSKAPKINDKDKDRKFIRCNAAGLASIAQRTNEKLESKNKMKKKLRKKWENINKMSL